MVTTVINLSRLGGNDGFRIDGESAFDSTAQVSNAGDVNGDGIDDLIIGSRGADPHGESSGSSYLIFGKASGFDASLNLVDLNVAEGFRINGTAELDESGFSVSGAGDVNGDGYDDVIIGAPGAEGDNDFNEYYGFSGGSSYVVFGKASFNLVFDLSNIDGVNGFRVDGRGNYKAGRSVSNTGDVNGDGFDDVIIGSDFYGPNYSGVSYVVFGKESGFDAVLNLSDLNGTNGFRVNGENDYDGLGRSVSSAGDINGDGIDDLIIGAFHANSNGINSGSSYIVFGRDSGFDATLNLSAMNGVTGFGLNGVKSYDASGFSVSNAGDVNGDGFDDVIIGAIESTYVVFGKASGFKPTMNLSSLDGNNGFRIDTAGRSVSGAGDINSDGFDDVIIGAASADPTGSNAGSSYIVFGKASGFDPILKLSSMKRNDGLRVDGEKEGDFSGLPVSGAGDINSDGFDDVIIGAGGADPHGESSGSSYVLFGRSSFTGGNVIAGTAGDDVLRGTAEADIFEAGDGNDLMIGRGGADVFYGGNGDDNIKVTDLNFQQIDGGNGKDVLHTDGKDLKLDLASFGGKIHGIETICIYGRGDNSLLLTADDVINLSDTSNTLKLHGNAGDLVTVLDGEWIDGGVNGFYHTYTHEDAVLLVGANLAINFV